MRSNLIFEIWNYSQSWVIQTYHSPFAALVNDGILPTPLSGCAEGLPPLAHWNRTIELRSLWHQIRNVLSHSSKRACGKRRDFSPVAAARYSGYLNLRSAQSSIFLRGLRDFGLNLGSRVISRFFDLKNRGFFWIPCNLGLTYFLHMLAIFRFQYPFFFITLA